MLQTLTCRHGNHTWQREGSRGRKPSYCPQHQPNGQSVKVASDQDNTETLTCAFDGHMWTRAKARGRKPPFCFKHRIGAAEADETAKPKGLPSVNVRPEIVERVLAGPRTELQRKIEYTVHELEHPAEWREHGDWVLLIDTHKRLIQQAQKELNPRPFIRPTWATVA